MAVLSAPLLGLDLLRRGGDYFYFRRLWAALPAGLRRRSPLRHYVGMIRFWLETLGIILVYDRLLEPRWLARVRVSGTPPKERPEWRERPFILVFLHTGGFGLIRYVLRSRGMATASLVTGLPEVLYHARRLREKGDVRYGLTGVPQLFFASEGLRPLVRFLQPESALVIALDGKAGESYQPYDVDGQTLYLKDGAVRLARRCRAVLVPVSVRRLGAYRYDLQYGEPVPDELVCTEDTHAAMEHLARPLWRGLQEDPEAMTWCFMEAMAPGKNESRTPWP